MTDPIRQLITASIEAKQRALNDPDLHAAIAAAADILTEAFAAGHRVYFCGNGGSAADAQHLAAEFSGRFYKDRKALPAEALHVNTSYLTAVANDYGYDVVYARLVEGITQPGDVLVGLSTSGNSPNIVLALEAARARGVHTIGLTGEGGGKMKALCDVLIAAPSADTPRIQECHILFGHIICQLVEEHHFG
jgi:D-sedoheptulose 7-phosphate isomerase